MNRLALPSPRRILSTAALTALFGIALLLIGRNATAQVTTYVDRTTFHANAYNLSLIDFEGIAPADGFVAYGPGGSLSLSGVTFTAGAGIDLFVNSSTYYEATFGPPGYDLGNGDYLLAGNLAPVALSILMPGSGVTAIAFDLGTFDDAPSEVQITLSDGTVLTASAPYPSSGFVGFTSAIPITSLDLLITAGNRQDTLALDTFEFGSAVPEGNSLLFLAIGILPPGAFLLRRRKIS